MKKLFPAIVALAALGACDVNVTSNDARTQQALNEVQETAQDFGNQASNFAEDAGDTLSNAAQDAGQEVQDFGNQVGTTSENGSRGNNQ